MKMITLSMLLVMKVWHERSKVKNDPYASQPKKLLTKESNEPFVIRFRSRKEVSSQSSL